MGWRSRDVLRAAALIAALYLTLRLLWIASPLILTAFLGVLFGLAVESGVDRLARFRIPRGLAAAIVVVGFYAALIGLGAWMAPTLREQASELKTRLPEAVDKVESWLNARQGGFFGFFLGGSEVAGPDTTNPTLTGVPAGRGEAARIAPPGSAPTARAPASGGQRPDSTNVPPEAKTPTSTLKDRLGGQLSGVTRYLFPFLTSTIAAFAGIVLITFLAIYIGADPDTYHRGLMHLFPHSARDRAGEVLSAMATVLRKWLVTQLIAMLVIGVVSTGVLLALGVKAAFALGLIAGLLEFVPTVGPLMSAVPAVAMGFIDSPQKALTVAIAYIAIQFLENHILIPQLMKGGLDLPPALTIIGQALMAILFGFLGLMVAVPALAAMMVPIKMLYVQDVVGDDIEIEDDGDDGDDDG